MKQRYVVTSISGWPVGRGSGQGSGQRKPRRSYYVLDSAYCYQIVAEYSFRNGRDPQLLAINEAMRRNYEDALEEAGWL